ncbi:MAG: stage III sporulation protein AA [Syntrophomonadaceae bacterium]|nr:stage III sporulation protein AA [Syntrophomonadaceae bacterium]
MTASQEVISYLTPRVRRLMETIPAEELVELEEIRMRLGRILLLRIGTKELGVTLDGRLTTRLEEGVEMTTEDLHKTLQIVSQSSIYALEEEFRNGFLTLPGGHRVGLVGQTVLEKGRIKTLKYISGLNFRIGRQVLGAADRIMAYLINPQNRSVYHTLLISPPKAGKTTLLRDIIRQLSNGIPELGFPGVNVGLVDERSEIAGCYAGVSQKEIGLRTDVLDRCPKAKGMIMLLRSMSPQVVATDEIGRREDAEAIEDLLNAGVTVITTVHGVSLVDLRMRPVIRDLITQKIFERFVLLSYARGPGTIEAIIDGRTERPLLGQYVT